MNWDAPAKLIERSDGGSELAYDFRDVMTGTVAEMVRAVRDMDKTDRSRLLLDAGGQGSLTVNEVLVLAAREDFPALN